MKVLLDENIPVQLRHLLGDHVVASVNDADLGWKNIKNGKLLSEMEGRFDLLITADKSIYAQQNLAQRPIALLVLPTNRKNEVMALSGRLIEVIPSISSGQYVVIARDGSVTVRILDQRRP